MANIAPNAILVAIYQTYRKGSVKFNMPYAQHPNVTTPPDDTVLWRYMDFAKFVQMLESRQLWFARADQFADPLEGTLTDAELRHLEQIGAPSLAMFPSAIPAHAYRNLISLVRFTTYVNCWRSGQAESFAMWDLYGKGHGILAIKTTVAGLKAILSQHQQDVYIGTVSYISWESASLTNNALELCVRKDESYEHEQEVRALLIDRKAQSEWNTLLHTGSTLWSNPNGQALDCDLNSLIDEIVVGPREMSWIGPLVNRVCERYGLLKPIKCSDRLNRRKAVDLTPSLHG